MYDCLVSYEGHPLYMRMHNILTLHGKGDYYITHMHQDYGNPVHNGGGNADIVVSFDKKKNLIFNWDVVDSVYDIVIAHGMHPIVETVYMPHCLRLNDELYLLPSDYNVWENVLKEFVTHCISRYGISEVKKWYFEICNEPENFPLWREDLSTFFALYDYFEYAIHSINSDLRVGGPAVKQWDDGQRIFKNFLEHCSRGVNYKTGKFGSRVDFLSVHSKGGIPEQNSPSIDYMFNPLRKFAETLKQYPCFDGIEFFNDESDIVWEGNQGINIKSWLNFRNTHYAPGFTCKMIQYYCDIVQDELGINLSIVDSDNCHLTWEKYLFSGNRSQFTPLAPAPCCDIIRKPVFNAFQLLGKLGNERYILKNPDEEFGKKYGAIATRDDYGYACLLWNFEDGLDDNVNPRMIHLHLTNLSKKSSYTILHFRIDSEHSNAYGLWAKMGKPYPLSNEQIQELRLRDGLELFEPVYQISCKEEFNKEIMLPMHAVSLIMLIKTGRNEDSLMEKAIQKSPEVKIEESFSHDKQVFLKWHFSERKDVLGYRVYREDTLNPGCNSLTTDKYVEGSYYTDTTIEKGRSYKYSISAVYGDGTESKKSPATKIDIS